MERNSESKFAFTLTELLVVLGVVAILAALIFPAMSQAKSRARRATCLNNLKQNNLFLRMYADEHNGTLPAVGGQDSWGWSEFSSLLKRYAGLTNSSPEDKLFTCPDDQFYYDSPNGTNAYIPAPMHQDAR